MMTALAPPRRRRPANEDGERARVEDAAPLRPPPTGRRTAGDATHANGRIIPGALAVKNAAACADSTATMESGALLLRRTR